MGSQERPADRGRRQGEQIERALVEEYRLGRVGAGLSQRDVGRAIGLSDSEISRIERGRRRDVPIRLLSQLLTVVGLNLSARAFPGAPGLRDAGQIALLGRLRIVVSPTFAWQVEVVIARAGDLRAWDAALFATSLRIGIDAETRIRDLQAIERRIHLKQRDSGYERAILLVADTRHNRQIINEFRREIEAAFPVPSRVALAALREGRDPGGNALILL